MARKREKKIQGQTFKVFLPSMCVSAAKREREVGRKRGWEIEDFFILEQEEKIFFKQFQHRRQFLWSPLRRVLGFETIETKLSRFQIISHFWKEMRLETHSCWCLLLLCKLARLMNVAKIIKAFSNGATYCADRSNMNDPFACSVDLALFLPRSLTSWVTNLPKLGVATNVFSLLESKSWCFFP